MTKPTKDRLCTDSSSIYITCGGGGPNVHRNANHNHNRNANANGNTNQSEAQMQARIQIQMQAQNRHGAHIDLESICDSIFSNSAGGDFSSLLSGDDDIDDDIDGIGDDIDIDDDDDDCHRYSHGPIHLDMNSCLFMMSRWKGQGQ